MPYHLELEAEDVGSLIHEVECGIRARKDYDKAPFVQERLKSLRRILRQLKKLAKEKV